MDRQNNDQARAELTVEKAGRIRKALSGEPRFVFGQNFWSFHSEHKVHERCSHYVDGEYDATLGAGQSTLHLWLERKPRWSLRSRAHQNDHNFKRQQFYPCGQDSQRQSKIHKFRWPQPSHKEQNMQRDSQRCFVPAQLGPHGLQPTPSDWNFANAAQNVERCSKHRNAALRCFGAIWVLSR